MDKRFVTVRANELRALRDGFITDRGYAENYFTQSDAASYTKFSIRSLSKQLQILQVLSISTSLYFLRGQLLRLFDSRFS